MHADRTPGVREPCFLCVVADAPTPAEAAVAMLVLNDAGVEASEILETLCENHVRLWHEVVRDARNLGARYLATEVADVR
jgi:hypothetical protein